MESKNLVICDREEGYMQAFARYIMKKEELAIQVQTCSDLAQALKLQEKAGVDYLFISADYPADARRKLTADKVFVLTDGPENELNEPEIAVYKYQPGNQLLAELIRQCSSTQHPKKGFLKFIPKKQGKIIGIFSPVHRLGQTSYALELGESLAKEANVLYLNLETYGGVGGHFGQGEQTLSDVLYYSRQEKSNIGLILTTLVQRRGHLDCVAPMQVSEDLKGVTKEEWMNLIRGIMEQSVYEILILDMDEGIRDTYALLDICTEIHMLTAKEEIAEAKIRQFEEELLLLGYDSIRKKLIRKEQSL